MVEAALTRGGDSASLDILTYSDLSYEASPLFTPYSHHYRDILTTSRIRPCLNYSSELRARKTGVSAPAPTTDPAVLSRRYVIITYQSEFDRVHYPLPLTYEGPPDPAVLQREIRQLRAQQAIFADKAEAVTLKESQTAAEFVRHPLPVFPPFSRHLVSMSYPFLLYPCVSPLL